MEKFTKKYFVVAYYILGHPYQVKLNNNSKLSLKLRKSKQTYIWQIFCAFVTLFVIYSSVLLLVSFEKYVATQKFLQLAFHIIWLVCSVIAVVTHVPKLFGYLEVMQLNFFINSITENLEKESEWRNVFKKSRKFKGTLLYAMCIYSIFAMVVFFSPIFYICRSEPFQMGYIVYISLENWNFYAATFLSICVDIWYGLTIWSSYILLLHVNISYMLTLKCTMVELMGYQLTKRHFQNCFNNYSKFRIVNTLYNIVYGTLYLPPSHALYSFDAVVDAVLCIRLASKDDIPFIVCGGSFMVFLVFALLLLISFTAMVYEYNRKLEGYLKKRAKVLGKQANCIVRSFRVECISSGGIYPIKKMTVVSALGFLSNSISSALISVQI